MPTSFSLASRSRPAGRNVTFFRDDYAVALRHVSAFRTSGSCLAAFLPRARRAKRRAAAAYPIGLRSRMREIATVSAGSCKRTADSGQNLGVIVAGG
jgi:hypothetical protein